MSERPLPSALVGKVIRGFRTTTDPKGWKAGHVNIPDLQDFFYGKGVQPDLVERVEGRVMELLRPRPEGGTVLSLEEAWREAIREELTPPPTLSRGTQEGRHERGPES